MILFDSTGQRKYLNLTERKAFKVAAEKQPREKGTFCLVLYYTGCRIAEAGIDGMKATPKGLRHAFGIAANQKGIQLNMVQRWLGHADIKTTAIYSEAVGVEERNLAQRLWENDSSLE